MSRGDILWKRLESASSAELRKLAEIMGVNDADRKADPVLVEELSRDIRSAAGHSLRNLYRGDHDFPYKQMLIDVADKMAPGWTFLSWTRYYLGDDHTEFEIEDTIWGYYEKRVEDMVRDLLPAAREQLRKNTEAELRRLGYSDALVSQIGASLVSGTTAILVGPALAYHIALNTASGFAWIQLWWAGKAALGTVLGVSGGLFALLYAPVLVWWLGNTAYRKTVPVALQLISIRKVREFEEQLG